MSFNFELTVGCDILSGDDLLTLNEETVTTQDETAMVQVVDKIV